MASEAAALGKATLTEAIDRTGKAATAAAYQLIESCAKDVLTLVPGGDLLARPYDEIVSFVGRTQIVEKTYSAVKRLRPKRGKA